MLFGVLASAVAGPNAQTRVTVLEGGTLIDGTGRAPVTDTIVIVEADRIEAVGWRGQLARPPGAELIDVSGRTILPGLSDGQVGRRCGRQR